MTKYHINPETGNANRCTAKKRCRFGNLVTDHYATAEEARAAYEEAMAPTMSSAAHLLLRRNRVQKELLSLLQRRTQEGGLGLAQEESAERIALRNALDKELAALGEEKNLLPLRQAEASLHLARYPLPQEAPHPLSLPLPPADNSPRYGFDAYSGETLFSAEAEAKELSEEWLKRLSSPEVLAILHYSQDSSTYAKEVGRGTEFTDRVHAALRKAPPFTPTMVYSGLSYQTRDLVQEALASHPQEIYLPRALSTSFNPAQVNGFMTRDYMKPYEERGDTWALEIEATQGGVMTAASAQAHELEVLLPPGRYEVVASYRDVNYCWNRKGNNGIGAEQVYRLRQLPSS